MEGSLAPVDTNQSNGTDHDRLSPGGAGCQIEQLQPEFEGAADVG